MRPSSAVSALVWSSLAIMTSAAALAGPLDVKAPEIEAGETELATNHAFQSGFPEHADRVRHAFEIVAGHAFTSSFRAGVRAGFDRPLDESGRLSVAGVEAQVFLGKLAPSISWGWFAGLDLRVHDHETNTIIFGPLIRFGDEVLSLTVNPFLEQTFAPNRDGDPTFSYAVALKGAVREGFAIGIEAFGAIPELGNGSASHFHEHRVGPVVYLERELAPAAGGQRARKLSLEIGGFVGLTDAAPDWTGKVKAALTW